MSDGFEAWVKKQYGSLLKGSICSTCKRQDKCPKVTRMPRKLSECNDWEVCNNGIIQ